MNTAEIVIRKVQRASGFEVRGFLRESVRESGKPSHHHANREVLPFDVAGRNLSLIGIPLMDFHDGFDDWAWGVFCFAVMLPIVAIKFYKLCEIHFRAKRVFNGVHVKPESVCGDLDAISESLRQIINQDFRSWPCCAFLPCSREPVLSLRQWRRKSTGLRILQGQIRGLVSVF